MSSAANVIRLQENAGRTLVAVKDLAPPVQPEMSPAVIAETVQAVAGVETAATRGLSRGIVLSLLVHAAVVGYGIELFRAAGLPPDARFIEIPVAMVNEIPSPPVTVAGIDDADVVPAPAPEVMEAATALDAVAAVPPPDAVTVAAADAGAAMAVPDLVTSVAEDVGVTEVADRSADLVAEDAAPVAEDDGPVVAMAELVDATRATADPATVVSTIESTAVLVAELTPVAGVDPAPVAPAVPDAVARTPAEPAVAVVADTAAPARIEIAATTAVNTATPAPAVVSAAWVETEAAEPPASTPLGAAATLPTARPIDAMVVASVSNATAASVVPDITVAAIDVTPEPKPAAPAAKPKKPKAAAGAAPSKPQKPTNVDKLAAAYAARLAKHLNARAPLPPAQPGFGRRAVVVFTIDAGGRVFRLQIFNSTGSAYMDSQALAAVRQAAPFPPIPDELDTDSFIVRAPIQFPRPD